MSNNLQKISIASLALLLPTAAKAFCPVCTVAVGAGLGLARWLKIDDTITGLWIGGLIVSLIGWTINWLNAKKIRFIGRKPLIIALYYVSIIWPLYHWNLIGHPIHSLWGIDKLVLGMTLGSIFFLFGGLWYSAIKAKNNNHAQFPFQKLVMPISPLVILSIVFYFLTK
jgi:hypothetical protein